MRSRSRRFRIAVALAPVGLFVAVFGWLTYARVHQDRLDRALIKAVGRDDQQAVVQLLTSGADPNARDYRNEQPAGIITPIRQTVWPDRSATTNTALILAIRRTGWEEDEIHIVRALLKAGADVNAGDADGWTPLMHAVLLGKTELVNMLLDRSANVNARNRYGVSVLNFARSSGDANILRIVLDRGADVNARDSEGKTELMRGAMEDNVGTVQAMISMGADIRASDRAGKTALAWAIQNGHPDIAVLLKQAGAKE